MTSLGTYELAGQDYQEVGEEGGEAGLDYEVPITATQKQADTH